MSTITWDSSRKLMQAGSAVAHPFRDSFPEFDLDLAYAVDIRLDDLEVALRAALNDAKFDHIAERYAELTVCYGTPLSGVARSEDEAGAVDAYSIRSGTSALSIEVEIILQKASTPQQLLAATSSLIERAGFIVTESSLRFGESCEAACLELAATRPATIQDVAMLAQSLRRVSLGISLTDRDVIGLHLEVLASRGQVLLGAPESELFDAKEIPYRLDSDEARLEFALDIGSFANSDAGGVIVLGAVTKKDRYRQDLVTQVNGFDPGNFSLDFERCRAVFKNLIFPPPSGIELEIVALTQNRHLGVVLVPPQRDRDRPFLVRRSTLKNGRGVQNSFCIPIRKGDSKTYLSVEEIHRQFHR
ncbi:hypothetical protein [Amycolatopsis pigmentata]|uniref:Schlafen AlbA-2 domain-containing protein n=1 Tax=Amycolatopsis pigmentata TaxID=450801 RepID=A0ABW5FLE0_9PSEU